MRRFSGDELRAFDHHQKLRGQGVPMVSVLQGDPGALATSWSGWLARRGFDGWSPPVGERELESAWLQQLTRSPKARDALLARLASASGSAAAELSRKSVLEIGLTIESASLTQSQAQLCRWRFVEDAATVAPRDALPTWLPLLSPAMALLVGPAVDPAQLVALIRLAERLPALPIGVLVGQEVSWSSSLAPRLRALLEHGRIVLPSATRDQVVASGEAAALTPSLATLVELGAAPSTLTALVACERALTSGDESIAGSTVEPAADAASRRRDPSSGERQRADGARSAVERLMSRILELHPELRGRFALNQRVACDFAQGEAEVDFLDPRLRLAIEVDGWYHFRDEEAYRRDRRKDLALQHADFVVVRVLASDITRRLADVLQQLTAVVRLAVQRHAERNHASRP